MEDEEKPDVSRIVQIEEKCPYEEQMKRLAEFKSRLTSLETPSRSWWGELQTRLAGIGLGRTR